jgi:hypothetical protein
VEYLTEKKYVIFIIDVESIPLSHDIFDLHILDTEERVAYLSYLPLEDVFLPHLPPHSKIPDYHSMIPRV